MSIFENEKTGKIKRAIKNRYLNVKRIINGKISGLGISKLSSKTIIVMGTGAVCVALLGSAFAAPAAAGYGNAANAGSEEQQIVQEQEVQSYWAIMAGDNEIVALETEKEAKEVLEGITAGYMTEGASLVDISYDKSVRIAEKIPSAEEIKVISSDDAIDIITAGCKVLAFYTTEKGERLSDIASKYNMSEEELATANPEFTDSNLVVGSKLCVYEMKPFFISRITERLSDEHDVEYSIVYEETESLYKDEKKVKTAGINGKNKVITEQIIENGVIVSSKEVETIVLKKPQDQVVLKGTKKAPSPALYGSTNTAAKGSGKYCSPLARLEVSSAYGVSRGSGRHQGVDLRNPQGTPIMAVDSGTVVFAGYQGSYGNLVKISHGGGLETCYAHCDSMSVSVGQSVSKGQVIATVGKTGRATGYHLHFEVRINGKVQNPMNYL